MSHDAVVAGQAGAATRVDQSASVATDEPAAAGGEVDTADTGDQAATGTGAASQRAARTAAQQQSARRAAGAVAGGAPDSASEISLGVVGTLSGPVGAVYAQAPTALRVWSRQLNDRGGVAGHRVTLIFVDDGGDPARYVSALKDLVENRHVLAFVGNPAPVTNTAGRSYLESRRVPVLGGDLGSSVWIQSPMHFPQGTTADEQLFGVLATGARTSGKVKFGTMACQELQVCRDADRLWQGEYARALKLQPVSRAMVALAQPDFTAECLSARQAGAEMLIMAIDINSAYRIGASCARVGFHPPMSVPYSGIANQQAKNADLDGLMGTLPTFPWLATDTPAAVDFAAAMHRYSPGAQLSGSASVGWTAGKLFEKAAANIGEPPSRERLLEALWAMRGETLGGLTQPLTFTKDRPAPRNRCWFGMRIVKGQWTAPTGSRPSCP